MISIDYKENSKRVVVTTLHGRKPMSRTVTDKATGITTIEVFKEGNPTPVETYVYNRTVDDNRQMKASYAKTSYRHI